MNNTNTPYNWDEISLLEKLNKEKELKRKKLVKEKRFAKFKTICHKLSEEERNFMEWLMKEKDDSDWIVNTFEEREELISDNLITDEKAREMITWLRTEENVDFYIPMEVQMFKRFKKVEEKIRDWLEYKWMLNEKEIEKLRKRGPFKALADISLIEDNYRKVKIIIKTAVIKDPNREGQIENEITELINGLDPFETSNALSDKYWFIW